LWNFCSDKKCNQFAQEISDARAPLDVSDGLQCADDEERRMTTEELYQKMLKNAKKIVIPNGQGQWDAPIAGKDSMQGKGKDKGQSDVDRQIWENRIKDFMEKNQGSMPGGLMRELEGLFNPEVPWQQLLQEYANEAATGMTDFTWKKFNRVWRMYDYYLPGMKGDKVNVFIAADTSGSMGNHDLRRIFTEAKDIMDRYGSVYYLSCDARVHSSLRVDSIEEMVKNTKGGGGTDFKPVFKHVDEMYYTEETPPVLVFFTDGYGDFPSYEPPYPVIWVMIDSDVQAPFGKQIEIRHRRQ
jgi:predicted metal-dependent peptidase